MGKDSRRFKDISKLFGMDPTSGSGDFEVQLVNLISRMSEIIQLVVNLISRMSEIIQLVGSRSLDLFEEITDKLITIDRRVTALEDEIFYADEDTTPQGKEENCSNQ
jgi:hypothetical protein